MRFEYHGVRRSLADGTAGAGAHELPSMAAKKKTRASRVREAALKDGRVGRYYAFERRGEERRKKVCLCWRESDGPRAVCAFKNPRAITSARSLHTPSSDGSCLRRLSAAHGGGGVWAAAEGAVAGGGSFGTCRRCCRGGDARTRAGRAADPQSAARRVQSCGGGAVARRLRLA